MDTGLLMKLRAMSVFALRGPTSSRNGSLATRPSFQAVASILQSALLEMISVLITASRLSARELRPIPSISAKPIQFPSPTPRPRTMASSSVLLGGGAGTAALAAAGKTLLGPCFLAARPRAVSGGRLCLQTAPRSSPAYNKATDAAGEAIETVKGLAGEAAGKASDAKDSVAEAAGDAAGKAQEAVESAVEGAKSTGESVVEAAKGGASKVSETAQDLGGQAKDAAEGAWDATKDAAQGVADKVAAAAKDLS